MADLKKRNTRTLVALVAVLAGMGALTASAVPLYRAFCQLTGYGGTTQVATEIPDVVSERTVIVRFDANTSSGLPWKFTPVQREIEVRLGEVALAGYVAENMSDRTITGTSTFNVTPNKAGPYFSKVQCFCFQSQTLAPGERVDMPVSFFVDPEMLADVNMDEVRTITLSYTFFESLDQPEPRRVAANHTDGAVPQ